MATLFTSIHHKTPYDTRATRHSIQEANNTEKEIKSYLKEEKKSHKNAKIIQKENYTLCRRREAPNEQQY